MSNIMMKSEEVIISGNVKVKCDFLAVTWKQLRQGHIVTMKHF